VAIFAAIITKHIGGILGDGGFGGVIEFMGIGGRIRGYDRGIGISGFHFSDFRFQVSGFWAFLPPI